MAVPLQFLRDDGVAATGAGESGGLGHGTEFNGAGAGTFHLEDAANGVVHNEVLISGIINDDGVLCVGVVHPLLQLLLAVGSTGGVVGRAEVNEVRMDTLVGHGAEAVLLGGGSIDDLPAGHNVGVHIDGVHGVRDEHDVVLRENVLKVGTVALGAVSDEDLIGSDFDAEALIVVGNGFPHEGIALVVRVTLEGLCVGEVRGPFLEGLYSSLAKGQGHIANAHADDRLVRVCRDVLIGLAGHICEEIIGDQVVEIGIDFHFTLPFRSGSDSKFAESIP